MIYISNFACVSVLAIPDYRDGNPYQSNLQAGLEDEVTYGHKDRRAPVCRAILSGNVTVVHLHWFSGFFKGETHVETAKRLSVFLLWLFLIRLRTIPMVWTVHNVRVHDSEYPRLEHLLKQWFINSSLCSRLIVHCEAVQEELLDEYGLSPSIQERIDVIPHGHYLENYPSEVTQQEARESLGLSESDTVFLFFGKVCPYKGIETLLEAFENLSIPDRRLLIAGNPVSDEFELTLLRQSKSDRRILTVFEFIPDDEIQLYMSAADVVVLPYRRISTSGSAVLAMSFGRAVVAPSLGCLPELLSNDGAEIYDPSKPDGLRTALETVIDRDLEAMGSYNKQTVADYDWDRIAEQTQETYRKAR